MLIHPDASGFWLDLFNLFPGLWPWRCWDFLGGEILQAAIKFCNGSLAQAMVSMRSVWTVLTTFYNGWLHGLLMFPTVCWWCSLQVVLWYLSCRASLSIWIEILMTNCVPDIFHRLWWIKNVPVAKTIWGSDPKLLPTPSVTFEFVPLLTTGCPFPHGLEPCTLMFLVL